MTDISVPEVGDCILVPNNKTPSNPIAKELIGGKATVHRVTCACANDDPTQLIHYVWVLEHTPYQEYKWEGFLAELQETLSKEFTGVNQAYFKSI